MKQLKALFGLAVVVAAFYMAWTLIPIYYNNYSFQDEMDNEARMATYSQKSEQEVAEILAKKAKDLEIPVTPEMIHVQKNSSEVTIWTEYTVSVQTPIKTFDLKFTPSSKNKRI